MILCHKCAGVLAVKDNENTTDLLGCSCISGYVRGFEKQQNRAEAITSQIERTQSWIGLYERQGRPTHEIERMRERLKMLQSLIA